MDWKTKAATGEEISKVHESEYDHLGKSEVIGETRISVSVSEGGRAALEGSTREGASDEWQTGVLVVAVEMCGASADEAMEMLNGATYSLHGLLARTLRMQRARRLAAESRMDARREARAAAAGGAS